MNKKQKLLALSVLSLVTFLSLFFGVEVMAQCDPSTVEGQIQCGADNAAGGSGANAESTIQDTVTGIVNLLTFIVGAIAVILIIYAGYKFVTSSGDPGKVASAKTAIVYALIGIGIAAAAQILTKFVIEYVI